MATVNHLTTPDAFEGESLVIEGEAYRHLFRARRLAVGDPLRVVNGRGRARVGEVEQVERKVATIRLGEPLATLEPELRVDLLVGALRPERASWLVEKATEMGVERILFMATERTPRDYGRAKLERWRRVAASAVEQCGRSFLPEVEGVLGLDEALERSKTPRFALEPGAEPLAEMLPSAPAPEVEAPELSLLIGPEGGFGRGDQSTLEGHGVKSGRLGPTILRVETAAIAALAFALCR